MRLLNVFAALSGLVALTMLTIVAHAMGATHPSPEDIERIKLAAFLQLGAAASGLAIANRSGRLNLIAGILILTGAAIFAGTLYTVVISHSRALVALAPIGGITLLLGWFALVFAKPGA
jgi:uncharacterized membrane protein YgdD (TMEM256/DUF423 family)